MDPKCTLRFVLALLVMLPLAYAVPIDDITASYIQSCIKTYEQNCQNTFFDNIIPPPTNFDVPMDESIQRITFLPKVIIWCPITMHRLNMACPKHDITLKPTYWQCKSDIWRQPRLVYDMNGNILLVSRMYVCSRECRLLSSDKQLLDLISDLIYVPFTLFHKCGYTDTLKAHINGQICAGVSFSQIQTTISETHSSYLCRKVFVVCKKIMIKNGKTFSNTMKDKLLDEMATHYLYTPPSNDLLTDIFLDNFERNKYVFEENMRRLTAESISTDHTFKISKNIGIHDLENHWSKQYESVLIIMNESGQVVAWAFTKSQTFEEVRPLFEQLRDRLLANGRHLTTAYVDICCKWRQKLQSVFGVGLAVKLDLFHAVKRIVGTLSKRQSFSAQRRATLADLSLVFRKNNDQGPCRQERTPDPPIMTKNLDRFVSKWQNVGETLCDATFDEIHKLKCHIDKGCLSGLRPHEGTEQNESLHRILNNALSSTSRVIGPELAFALITIFFYTFNRRHNSNAIRRSMGYIDVEYLFSGCKSDRSLSSFGFLHQHYRKSKIQNANKCDSESLDQSPEDTTYLTKENASLLISEMLSLHEIYSNVSSQCESKGANVFDYAYISIKHTMAIMGGRMNLNTCALNEHSDRLERHLAAYNLERVTVIGDGNCAFRAIMKQLEYVLQCDTTESDHLKLLMISHGLLFSEDDNVSVLRELFVKDIILKRDKYISFTDFDSHKYLEEAERYRHSGNFSGQLGDLIMMSLSSMLQVPIIVITSMDTLPTIPLIPEQVVYKKGIYVAYTQYGPGHYDATSYKHEPVMEITQPSVTPLENSSCRCGRDKIKSDPQYMACNSANNKTSNYKTRCPCVKSGVGCDECVCVNCHNSSNKDESLCSEHMLGNCLQCRRDKKVEMKHRKRRTRDRHKRKLGQTFMAENAEEITDSGWSSLETVLLDIVISFLSKLSTSPPDEHSAFELYNYVVALINSQELLIGVRDKTTHQITGKMRSRRDKQTLYFQLVIKQLQIELSN